MKITMTTYMQTQKLSLVSVAAIGSLLWHQRLWQPGKREGARGYRADIAGGAGSHFAVDFRGGRRFPRSASVITPKITAPIREFFVKRGSPVRKGQLLAILENKDLAAAAGQSKGEFEQAEAGYATTVGAAFPSRCRKPNWTLPLQRSV